MPSYTLGEIMSQATARVGRRSDLSSSDVSFLVNTALQEVAQAVPHALEERVATVATTVAEPRVGLPLDFVEPINLTVQTADSRASLRQIDVAQLDAKAPSSGQPTDYAFFNEWVELYPTPDSAYTVQLRYRAAPSDLSELADIPSLSTPWRHAVLLRTESLLHEFLGNYPAGAAAQGRYLAYVSQLDSDQARRQKAREKVGVQLLY